MSRHSAICYLYPAFNSIFPKHVTPLHITSTSLVFLLGVIHHLHCIVTDHFVGLTRSVRHVSCALRITFQRKGHSIFDTVLHFDPIQVKLRVIEGDMTRNCSRKDLD